MQSLQWIGIKMQYTSYDEFWQETQLEMCRMDSVTQLSRAQILSRFKRLPYKKTWFCLSLETRCAVWDVSDYLVNLGYTVSWENVTIDKLDFCVLFGPGDSRPTC